jgi:hypothetical protein
MANHLIPKEDWARFSNLSYSFLNSIHADFNYKANKSIDKTEDDPLEYRKLATPMIAMFLAFGVSEKDIIEEKIKLAMKPITRQTSLNYLKAKGYSQTRILKMIIDNWDTCPPMLKGLLRQTNSNFIFPIDKVPEAPPLMVPPRPLVVPGPPMSNPLQATYPNFQPPSPEMIQAHRSVQPHTINFTLRDRAIAKYINNYLIEIMGYNTYDSIVKLFKERGATDFIFNNKYEIIMGEDFQRLRRSIQEYGKSNFGDIPDIQNCDRIYFVKFKQILERFVQVFPYAPDVVHNLRKEELSSYTVNQQQASLPTQVIEQPQVIIPQPVFTVPEPQQTVQIQQRMTPQPTPPISQIKKEIEQKNNTPQLQQVSQGTAQMIALLVEGLDATQTRMAFALLQDASSLKEFADAIARRFAITQNQ